MGTINSIISKAKKAKVDISILEKMEFIAFKAYIDFLNDFGGGPEIYEDKVYDHLKNYISLVLNSNTQKDIETKLKYIENYLLNNTNMCYDYLWELFEELTGVNLNE